MLKKKIVTLMLALGIGISQMSVFAKISEADLKYDVLYGLNILGEKKSEYISYNDFLAAVVRCVSDREVNTGNLNSVVSAVGFNDFNGGGNYITINDACEMMLTVLGYRSTVTDGDFYSKAAETGLLKGFSYGVTNNLTFDNAVTVLYNMIQTEVLKAEFSPEFNLLYGGENLLEAARDIEVVKGVVEENGLTSISGESGISEDEVKIGDIVCADENGIADEFLGMNVRAYVQYNKKDDTYKLLYLYGDRNRVLDLNADDIENVSDDFRTFEYLKSNKTSFVKLSPVLKVIYNGKYYGQYEKKDLMPLSGNVKLIDNDNDGVYDIAKVTCYDIMVVDRVSMSSMVIYNEYTFDGCLPSIDLSEEDRFILEIVKDGEAAGLSDIKPGDVLNVMRTKELYDGYVKIIITSSSRTVTVTGKNTGEKLITTNDGDFELSESFLKEYEAEGEIAKNIQPGNTYTAMFDMDGKIAGLVSETKEYEYFLLVKIVFDEDTEEIILRGRDMQDVVVDLAVKDKIRFNGENSVKIETAVSDFIDGSGKTIPQIIEIKKSGNVVNCIRTAEATGVDEDKFTKSDKSGTYRPVVQTFGNKIYLDKAKVVISAKQGSNDTDDYYVTDASGLRQDGTYTFTAYNLDEYGYTDLIMLSLSDAEYRKMFEAASVYVAKISDAYKDGEAVQKLDSFVPGYGVIPVYSDKAGVFDGLNPGDRVSLSINNDGRVFYALREFSVKNVGGISDVSDIYTSTKYIYGNIENIDIDRKHIKLDCNGINSLNITGASVVIYHSESREYETASVNDLEIGDYIFCTTSWSKVSSIYVVRED